MLEWVQSLFNLTPARQLEEIEKREPTLEEQLARLTGRLRGFNQRTAQELDEIISDLNTVLDIVEQIIGAVENLGGAERARNLRTKLRHARTRAQNALRATA